MMNITNQLTSFVGQYWAVILGAMIVASYAKKRFNEPSFPNRKALPQAVEPLRYLFLKSQYRRARSAYTIASVFLYLALLLPGAAIASIFQVDPKTVPPEAWALGIALVLVGLLPNSPKLQWILWFEEELRRSVHERSLVPGRVEETIALLQDVSYEPPTSQFGMLPEDTRTIVREGLSAPAGSLVHRWARATALMELLNQKGTGSNFPLSTGAREPFEQDFQLICKDYDRLKLEIGQYSTTNNDTKLIRSVNDLLDAVHAYISWSVRHQSNTETEVDDTLLALSALMCHRRAISLCSMLYFRQHFPLRLSRWSFLVLSTLPLGQCLVALT